MEKSAEGSYESRGFPPYGALDNDPMTRQNLVRPTTTTSKTSSSCVAVLLAGITLLVGTVVHVVSFSLPYWFNASHERYTFDRSGVNIGLWNAKACDRNGNCHSESLGLLTGGNLEPWFLALRAMETIGLISAILTCALFIALLVMRQKTTEQTVARDGGHNPLCGLSQLGRIFLISFTVLLFLAAFSIIIGVVISFVTLGQRKGSMTPQFAHILSSFSGFIFFISGTLAAAGLAEILKGE